VFIVLAFFFRTSFFYSVLDLLGLYVGLIVFDFGVSIKSRSIIIHILIHVRYSESNGTMRKIGFYMSLASRLACATCAKRCARSVF
jgi:hypothetical protein